MRSYIVEFERLSGVKCRMVVRPPHLVVREPLATVAYRIVQEAMTNVARHARASRCDIRLNVSDDQLELRVLDNGIGAEAKTLHEHQALGILGMRERASAVGGEVWVENGPKAGVLVKACLPLRYDNPTAAS